MNIIIEISSIIIMLVGHTKFAPDYLGSAEADVAEDASGVHPVSALTTPCECTHNTLCNTPRVWYLNMRMSPPKGVVATPFLNSVVDFRVSSPLVRGIRQCRLQSELLDPSISEGHKTV